MKLSDTQLVVLAAAAQRADGNLLPLPASLSGGLRARNAARVVEALKRRGLIAETVTKSSAKADPACNAFWRNDEDGRATLLHITPEGLAAIGIAPDPEPDAPPEAGTPADAAPVVPQCQHGDGAGRHLHLAGTELEHTTRCHVCDPEPEHGTPADASTPPAAAPPRRMRQGTKQAALIAMLEAPEGASVAEISAALGWQPHTVRAALSHALPRRLGLAVSSQKEESRGRVYRLAAAG